MDRNGSQASLGADRRGCGVKARKVSTAGPLKPRKARVTAPLTPDQAARVAEWTARQAEARRFMDRMAERRRLHPRREVTLDLLVGIPMIAGFVTLCLSYLHILHW